MNSKPKRSSAKPDQFRDRPRLQSAALRDDYWLPLHAPARDWWEHTINSSTEIGLTPPTIFGFLRIATNARVLGSPMTIVGAVAHVREWLEQPNAIFLVPGQRHLDIALGLLESVGTAANLTTDVQLAAFAIERQGEVHTNDADFGRFTDLRWVNPLQ